MGLETGTYISDLNPANPSGTDPKAQGDDHIRLIKAAVRNSFAGFSGAVLVTGVEAEGATPNEFVVTVAPAPAVYSNAMLVVFKAAHANTGPATVKVNALSAKALKAVDGSALEAGDIEAGAVVGAFYDGTDFLLVTANDRAARAGDSYTGAHDFTAASSVTAPTASGGDNSAKVATTAYVDAGDALKAPLASPALTGVPTAPTAAPETNTTQVATTAFVQQQAFQAVLPVQAGNGGKVLRTDGSSASWAAAQALRVQNASSGLLKSDINNAVQATGSNSPTWTLPNGTAAGAGTIRLINAGSGDVNISAAEADMIDGLTSYVMYPGEVRDVMSDGGGTWVSVVVRPFAKRFTASGSFVEPPSYRRLVVDGIGGGGGGGGINVGGGGGGGGGRSLRYTPPVPGTIRTVVIGGGGSGGTAGAAGSDGGTTSYGALFKFFGGAGGFNAGGGGGGGDGPGLGPNGGAGVNSWAGGAGGSGGSNGTDGSASAWGGGGGGGTGTNGLGGAGGGSLFGAGAGGGGASSGTGAPGGLSGTSVAGAGAEPGTAGANGDLLGGRAGGGGGGGANNVAGGAGGVAGGGGGGCGGTSQAGGAGGRGELVVYGEV